jgi:hypothetical protein
MDAQQQDTTVDTISSRVKYLCDIRDGLQDIINDRKRQTTPAILMS